MPVGNVWAYLVLLGSIPAGLALFGVVRPAVAVLAVLLGSFMFLPERVAVDLPLLPALGKQEVAALTALVGAAVAAPRALLRARPLRGIDLVVVALWMGDIGTALTNRDTLVHGPTILPALSLHEGISMVVADMLQVYAPFLLGRSFFVATRDLNVLLVGLAVAGVVYTPLLFVELMLSPQLHAWVYGFHQHDFVQTLRGGGYRPMVFMPHGLAVALFMVWSSLAALSLLKARRRIHGVHPALPWGWSTGFLAACKSLGAALYAAAAAPAIWLLRPRASARVASVLVAAVVVYPLLRTSALFPERQLVSAAEVVSARAAQSLGFRFEMETLLADHAAERPMFGWGRFRRNMVFDEDTGRPLSVSDGHWIVTYGIRGVWGWLCIFTLIVAPVLVLRRLMRTITHASTRIMFVGLSLILAVSAADLVLNALHNSFTFFLAGATWGLVHGIAPSLRPAHADLGERRVHRPEGIS